MVYLFMLILLGLLSIASLLKFPSYIAILVGTLPFILLAKIKGYTWTELFLSMKKGFIKPMNVYVIVTLLGATIAMWLAGGTLPLLIYLSVQFIRPSLFILSVFLITWFMTGVIGSAIGTTGMVGVLFISLARTGHVSLTLTAGAVISGIYLGERSSFVSSCANLVAELCQLNTATYIKKNIGDSAYSIGLIVLTYLIFSIHNPLKLDAKAISVALSNTFELHYLSLLPLIVLAILLAFRVKITKALIWSTLSAFIPAVLIEHYTLKQLFDYMFFGYSLSNNASSLISSLHNNGIWGMFQSSLIVMAASLMTGLFENTNLLSELKTKFDDLAKSQGNFTACLASSLLGASIGCSQTFAILFSDQMLSQRYDNTESGRISKSQHIANSAVVVSGLIPWNLAAAVPLSLLAVDPTSLFYAIALYVLPLGGLLKSKINMSPKTFQNYIR